VSVATTTPDGKPFQYVVFAFDGSRSLTTWRETLDFAKEINNAGVPIHFTYFVNAIYLLPKDHRGLYHPPHNAVGASLIGYGSTTEEIGSRVALINEAYQSGHEVGSHGVGHIPGYNWSKNDWKSELNQFAGILQRARDGIDTSVPLTVPADKIRGFRAPDLVVDGGLDAALDELGYAYDASHVSKMASWPRKIGRHWELPLASIPYDVKQNILSMDYNFYLSDSRAKDTLRKGTQLWQQEYDEMLAAYMNYFSTNYNGNRAPVFIGHHFSNWNDGLYWGVMKAAVRAICSKPYVRCATYQETIRQQ
jgi:peptidoglycan/xylan/chitin deacetylase (PgdA/CDA1 family)